MTDGLTQLLHRLPRSRQLQRPHAAPVWPLVWLRPKLGRLQHWRRPLLSWATPSRAKQRLPSRCEAVSAHAAEADIMCVHAQEAHLSVQALRADKAELVEDLRQTRQVGSGLPVHCSGTVCACVPRQPRPGACRTHRRWKTHTRLTWSSSPTSTNVAW